MGENLRETVIAVLSGLTREQWDRDGDDLLREAFRGRFGAQADTLLALFPGRSEAEVKEEALREAKRAANHDWLAFQSVWGSSPSDLAVLAFANKALDWLDARADRLAAGGGGDRG